MYSHFEEMRSYIVRRFVVIGIALLCLMCNGCGKEKEDSISQSSTVSENEKMVFSSEVTELDNSVQEENTNEFVGDWKDIFENVASLSVRELDGNLFDIEINLSTRLNYNIHWVFTGTYDEESDAIAYTGAKIEQTILEDGSKEENVLDSGVTGILWFDDDGFLRWENDAEVLGNDFVFASIYSDYFYENSIIEAIPGVVIDASSNITDGTYPVSFSREDIFKEEGKDMISVLFYNYDCYATEDIQRAKEGGCIRIQGKEVVIEQLQWLDNMERLDINGGYSVGGLSLCLEDGGYYYRSCIVQDFPDYYPARLISMPVEDSEGVALGEEWRPIDTSIVVEGDVIKKIIHQDIPTIIE